MNSRAIILVVDSTDSDRMHIVKQELDLLLQSDQLKDAVLLVFANKQDARQALSAAKVSELLGLDQLKDRNWQIQASSALSGQGLLEGLEWVAQHLS